MDIDELDAHTDIQATKWHQDVQGTQWRGRLLSWDADDQYDSIALLKFFQTVYLERGFCDPISSPCHAASLLASSNPIDLVVDIAQAIADAKSNDWVSAAADSIEVAQDIIDIGTNIGEAFLESRIEAIQHGNPENSDLGFQ